MSNRQIAYKVVQTLREAGFQALFAGGCVRDRLLDRPAKDYDVVTNAVPDQVFPLFRKTLKIGAKFGVVIVLMKGQQVEVATFRTEGGYQDGRHPTHVEFASAKEDASRRDFTVNGMFFDPLKEEIFDFVDGQIDLEKRILRTIGAPNERFEEDYLRMLRAIRFAVKLDFTIEPDTWQAIQNHAAKITDISTERIAMELEQILTHPRRADGMQLLIDSKLGEAIFPALTGRFAEYGIQVLSHLPEATDFALSLGAFWAGFDTKQAIGQIKKMRLSNDQLKHVRFLLDNRDVLLDEQMPLSTLKLLLHEPYFQDLVDFQKALQKAKGLPLDAVEAVYGRACEIADDDIHPSPLLDGNQLIALGAQPGPMVGRLAAELYIVQLEEKIKTSEQAEDWVKGWLKKQK
ncbi:MAG: CCA tRNA nucleotidyltransferase [Planctomycetota bacterium]